MQAEDIIGAAFPAVRSLADARPWFVAFQIGGASDGRRVRKRTEIAAPSARPSWP